jgi:hypothetical protein
MNPTPRVFPIPLYDPSITPSARRTDATPDFKVANYIGFFVDHISGNNIYGRITPILGEVDPNAGPAPADAFPMAIRLVQLTMARLSGSLHTQDETFRSDIATLLRATAVQVTLGDERSTRPGAPPDVVFVDGRSDLDGAMHVVERSARVASAGGDLLHGRSGDTGPDPAIDARRRQRVLPVAAVTQCAR